jgi:putative nucleotidyltransferase with HDIG domain
VDVIVDDTPEAIVLSSFDPVRREVARTTLERLFSDGRIHPARIEEMVVKARNELAQQIKHEGEQACQDIGLTNVHPELARLLGTLRYRSSYGHNVLSHSQDTAAIAGMIAAEIGFDEQTAKEAALFHDIGKAVEHDVDGPHAIIGGEILARLGRPAAVVQAVRSHHYDEEPRSPAAAILMNASRRSPTSSAASSEASRCSPAKSFAFSSNRTRSAMTRRRSWPARSPNGSMARAATAAASRWSSSAKPAASSTRSNDCIALAGAPRCGRRQSRPIMTTSYSPPSHNAPGTTSPLEILKVSATSKPVAVAGAIAGVVRTQKKVEVQAIGAGAINQAIKAIAISRGYVAPGGLDLVCIPSFIDISIDGEERTGIRLVVEVR